MARYVRGDHGVLRRGSCPAFGGDIQRQGIMAASCTCESCGARIVVLRLDAIKCVCGWTPGKATSKANKYGAVKKVVDSITFDSTGEARRYMALKLRQRAGEIRDLETQPRFPVIINGRTIFTYVADFRYYDATLGREIIEDYKSPATRTPAYRQKMKAVEAQYDIEITEVYGC